MMTGRDAPADLAEWKSRPAELSSQSLGRCVQLSEGGCVVERSGGGLGNAVVYTDAPVPVNHVWLVTVLATASRTGFREGLGVGLRSAPPSHKVPAYLPCGRASAEEWYYSGQCLYHDKRSHYFPDLPSLSDLSPGQTVGLMVTSGGGLHLYLDGHHRREIATGLPVNIPLWGAADVYGKCTKIKSEIVNGSGVMGMVPELPHQQMQPTEQTGCLHSPPYGPGIMGMGQEPPHPEMEPTEQAEHILQSPPYVGVLPSCQVVYNSPPTPTTAVHVYSCDRLVLASTNHQSHLSPTLPPPPITSHHSHNVFQPTHPHLEQVSPPTSGKEEELLQKLNRGEEVASHELGEEEGGLSLQDKKASSLLQRAHQLEEEVRRMKEERWKQVTEMSRRDRIIEELRAELNQHRTQSQHKEHREREGAFWQVGPHEVEIQDDKVLGTGAWGKVCEGYFRGQRVAVKCVHAHIVDPKTHARIFREINTMAQMRHPHLVLFVAAILDDHSGPKIITEILDLSLRSAYENQRLKERHKLPVFCDIAVAMNYLHCQRDPIIHRDLSTANVLLEAMAGDVWKAKVSDFGSANLVRDASTPGEGSVVYTAPEAFPIPPNSHSPKPSQTTKIDVYSYGVLLCEVVLARFPDPDLFADMVEEVDRLWPAMCGLIRYCIKTNPQRRPSMADIITQLASLQ